MKVFFAKYKRKFRQAFRYGNSEIFHREGFIFRLNKDGQNFYSEAAPLLGHSRESLKDVEAYLTKESASGFLDGESDFASIRFASDRIQNQAPFSGIRSNALLKSSELGELFEEYELLAQEGYQTFKIKIYPENLSLILEFLKNISGGRNKFRLDANGSLQESHWKHFLKIFPDLRPNLIDYIEEPLADWNQKILREIPVPLAMDESFFKEKDRLSALPVSVLIAKPMTLGSLEDVKKFCQATSLEVVFTSCLETEVGKRNLLSFLSELNARFDSGLNTGDLFDQNFMGDFSFYSEIPKINPQEALWLASLSWKEML